MSEFLNSINQQVNINPDAVACTFDTKKITYRQLEEISNCFASFLIAGGMTRETPVGVCVSRSLDMVPLILGIFKAGGVYVPIDINLPADRMNFMLADCGAAMLITEDFLKAQFSSFQGDINTIDEIKQHALNPQKPLAEVHDNDLAYIMYTSGSTGKPKGVMVEHHSINALFKHEGDALGITEKDVVACFAPLGFDASIWELFQPLTRGAQIILYSPEKDFSYLELARALDDKITLMQTSPGTYSLLLAAGWQGSKNLKLICGGDPLTRQLAARLLQCCSELWNGYGLTETTIDATFGRVYAHDEAISIGEPVSGTILYILDENMKPVHDGESGELYIGGVSLARGYVNQPVLTAERFITNPLSSKKGERLYKTGDVARKTAEGKIVFLGRNDEQIKVNDYRLEPSEIENLILGVQGVGKVVVMQCDSESGLKKVSAFAVYEDGVAEDNMQAKLLDICRASLAQEMVPAYFISLDSLPLTGNGKVDKNALKRIFSEYEHKTLYERENDAGACDISSLLTNYTPYDEEICVHEMIERQAAQTPEAIAITFEGKSITYRRLDERANQYAHLLLSKGLSEGRKAAVCLERNTDLAAALLGVLKTGAFYIPVDPLLPAGRIKYMMDDSAADLIITTGALSYLFDTDTSGMVLIDEARERLDSQNTTSPGIQTSPENMLYLIYTSGSTGLPKGVSVTHKNLFNLLKYMQTTPGLNEKDKVLAVTPLSFDIAAAEVFLPLTAGAEVILLGSAARMDGHAIKRAIENGATYLQCTPQTLRLLIDAGWEGNKNLKILAGGEAIHKNLVHQILPKCGSLWNMYGPTETTVWSSVKKLSADDAFISIGLPVANTALYVLDEELKPVVPGSRGELYIGGEGVSKGYWNKPDITSERFVINPFPTLYKEKRMYRTGDVVKLHETGDIEYIERNDNQIKLRGYRIEAGEIENTILQITEISQALVLSLEKDSPVLIAYLVPQTGSYGFETEKIKAGLISKAKEKCTQKLPGYMVPDHFVVLQEFPLNSNGKIDRKALPAPDIHVPAEESVLPAADNESAKTMRKIWARTLSIPGHKIQVTDNFFSLGGNSLQSMKLVEKLSQAGFNISIGDFFNGPTIEKLLQKAEQKKVAKTRHTCIVPLRTSGSRPPLFYMPAGRGNYTDFVNILTYIPQDQPVYYIQPHGADGKASPMKSIQQMAGFYLQAIESYAGDSAIMLAGSCLGGLIAYEMARMRETSGARVAKLVIFDAYVKGSYYFHPGMSLLSRKYRILKHQSRVVSQMKMGEIASHLKKRFKKGYRKRVLVPFFMRQKKDKSIDDIVINDFVNANLFSVRTYNFPPYHGDITIVRALDDPASAWFYAEPLMGWDKIVKGKVNYYESEGNHITMFREPHVKLIAGILNGTTGDVIQNKIQLIETEI